MKPAPPGEFAVNASWAEAFVQSLAQAGLRHVCISPGSRSTPLVLAFADCDEIEDHSIIDERASAFYALGLAQATGEPVAVVCTSGTAAANFAPAVCEAHAAGIPLLLLTADRPPVLRDSGASQTMNQVALFGSSVRWFHDVALPELREESLRYVEALARRAFAIARSESGPVHLNFPFRKPLVESGAQTVRLARHREPGAHPPLLFDGGRRAPDPVAVTALVRLLEEAERPLFVVGSTLRGHELAEGLVHVAERVGAPIFAEATSQLRFPAVSEAVVAPDLVLSSERLREHLRPDVIVRFGRPPLNWPLLNWMEHHPAPAHVVVSPSWASDPLHSATGYFLCDPYTMLDALRRRLPSQVRTGAWFEQVTSLGRRTRDALHRAIEADETTLYDGRVVYELLRLLPDDTNLFVSSSMPVRELETFGLPSSRRLRLFFNRGLNGIDGVVSSAAGVAAGRGRAVLLIGDVAFAHDVGGLAAAARNGVDLTVVVVNNAGGAIFDHLPGITTIEPTFTRHFVTEPDIAFDDIARAHGARHARVHSLEAFRDAIGASLSSSGLEVIEVMTDRQLSKEKRERMVEAAVRAAEETETS